MNGTRQFVLFFVSCCLLFSAACEKKKSAAKLPVGAKQTAPTLTVPLPESLPEQAPANVETAKSEPPPAPAKTTKPKPKPRTRKPPTSTPNAQGTTTAPNNASAVNEVAAGSPNTTTMASARPPKVGPDAAAEAAISADVSAGTIVAERDKANREIDAAESTLKNLDGKTLTTDQQSMVSQVRSYITQSRKALAEGDYERAVNLANKAKLLTDALQKM